MTPATLHHLAERVEGLPDITCPLCGETGFDVPGFIFSHDNWCEVRKACIARMANRNEEVAAALRAIAASMGDAA